MQDNNPKQTGKFFVLEGGDGSGKATQTNKLENKLESLGYNILHQEFPRYGNPAAHVTEQYLGKKYGKISAQAASILYTVDRFDAWMTEIKPHIEQGGIVVSDRWVSANKGHQVGKGKTDEERESILQYINFIEHENMGLPYATQTILLDVHPVVGQRLSGIGKNSKIEGKDLHEDDVNHLLNARIAYQYVAKKENWIIINAMKQPVESYSIKQLTKSPIEKLLRTPEEIHEDVYNKIKDYI